MRTLLNIITYLIEKKTKTKLHPFYFKGYSFQYLQDLKGKNV